MTKPKPKVAICIPSGDEWKADTAVCMSMLMARSTVQGRSIAISNFRRSVLPLGRYECAQWALEWGAEWLLWIDSDMTFPSNLLERLLAHQTEIVGCTASQRAPSGAGGRRGIVRTTCQVKSADGQIQWILPGPSTPLLEVESLGLAAVLTHRTVFERVPQPWFVFPVEVLPSGAPRYLGEDQHFFLKARECGFKVYVDPALSHEIGHVGSFTYTLSESADLDAIRSDR